MRKIKLSKAQLRMLQDLAEEHLLGRMNYYYYPTRQRKTGDLLVEKGLAEKDPVDSMTRAGFRITEAGRDWLEANSPSEGVIDLMSALRDSLNR